MGRFSKEALKSYLLMLLVATSIIQVGILWNNDDHGFPFNIFTTFFAADETSMANSDSEARDIIFAPYRIVASNGSEHSHWMVDKDSDQYGELWSDAKLYLKEILKQKQPQAVSAGEWGKLAEKKAFIFEFKTGIGIDLAKWFLDSTSSVAAEPSNILKICIYPDGDLNNKNTVYILDGEKVYKYTIPFIKNSLKKDGYDRIISSLEEDGKLRKYSVVGEFDSKGLLFINPDILVSIVGTKSYCYPSINISIPEKISNLNDTSGSGLEDIEGALLGKDQERISYDRSVDNNTVTLKNQDSIYKVYTDGLLEYKYMPETGVSAKGSAAEAFRAAYSFISGIKGRLIPDVDIYLSGIADSTGTDGQSRSYEFTFDYSAENSTVLLDIGAAGKDGRPVKNAITIKANRERVIESRWMVLSFEPAAELILYDIDFVRFYNDFEGTFGKFDETTGRIRAIDTGYSITGSKVSKATPVWITEKTNGTINIMPLKSKD
jgi:hypothetical protein